MKNEIHIGCSSFYNSSWKEVFYPKELPSKQWFTYYCEHFDTYEINGTFYKFPTLKVVKNWFDRSPQHFLFSVKAPKEITHLRKFIDCDDVLEQFYSIISEGLQHKLGCVLFQFPRSYHYSLEKLEQIISNLNLEFKNVLEFRHESWWNSEVKKQLIDKRITFCSVSHPQLPEPLLDDSPFFYIRLHGKTKMFYSNYSSEELKRYADLISNKKAFVYFNNTASSCGILNTIELKKLV